MPEHPHLTSKELKDIYQYISFDNSDIEKPIPRSKGRFVYPTQLHEYVLKNIFQGSCRHCHAPNTLSQKLTKKVFGKTNDKDLVVFPVALIRDVIPDRLKEVLSPGKNCAPSEFLVRLWSRHNEWYQKPQLKTKFGELRGMPLNEKPLDLKTIRIAKKWTEIGCPWPGGNLCTPCE